MPEDVIYSTGRPVRRRCPVHDQRPIHPARLALRLRVQEHWAREHTYHFLTHPTCPLCVAGTPRTP